MELGAHSVGAEGAAVDTFGAFAEAYGIDPGGAVLVRPDGVVAWRSTTAIEDPRPRLERVVRRLLYRY